MDGARILRFTGLALVLTVLVAGPFFRGLFFWTELLAAILVASIGFVLWLAGRRLDGLPTGIPGGPVGWGLLALLIWYLMQFTWAAYPRGNLDWVLRIAVAWMVYVMVRAESGPGLRRWLGWFFVVSAVGVSIMGFLEYAGYFAQNAELIEALNVVNLGDRMYTPLQYPNTAAAYLLAAVFAALGLALEDLRPWKSGLLTGLMTLLWLAFFFTLSRGAVVVLPFGLLALLIGLPPSKRWSAILLLGAAWAPVLAVVRSVGPAAVAHQVPQVFGWIGIAIMIGLALGLVMPRYLRLRGQTQVAILGVGLALGIGALAMVAPKGGLIPTEAARLLDLNVKTTNARYRFILFDDAWEMIQDRPWGRGGWGWERGYRQYQETYYLGQETHSHYLQTAVEAGILGLTLLTGSMLAALWAAWGARTQDPLAWGLAAGTALIAGHSIIDFNLSFGLIWLLFWAHLAASTQPVTSARSNGVALGITLTASVAVIGLSGILLIGSWLLDRAEAAEQAGRQEEALALAQKAAAFDRWNSAPLLLLSDQPALEKAIRLDPYLARPRWELSILLQNQGDWDGSLREARATVANAPLHDVYIHRLASVAGKVMVDALHNAQPEKAKELAQELVALAHMVEQARAREGSWMQPKPSLNPEFRLRYGQALYLTGEEQQAEPHLKQAAKVGLLGSEADVWLYAIYERRGDEAAATALAQKPWIRFLGLNPVYKAIRTWP